MKIHLECMIYQNCTKSKASIDLVASAIKPGRQSLASDDHSGTAAWSEFGSGSVLALYDLTGWTSLMVRGSHTAGRAVGHRQRTLSSHGYMATSSQGYFHRLDCGYHRGGGILSKCLCLLAVKNASSCQKMPTSSCTSKASTNPPATIRIVARTAQGLTGRPS